MEMTGLLYTIQPAEAIFPQADPPASRMMMVRGHLCECVREGEGYAVKRLISTNPADYLEPELAPGAIVGKF